MKEKKETNDQMNDIRADGYAISLDLGTNSIGWAVIDRQTLKLKRFKGKDLWGVRLFDKAKDCKERRSLRSQRTNKQRRSFRLHLLQKELKEDVLKEDENFFSRLKWSQKKSKQFLLFDGEYTDKDYYKEFPTISHLKLALTNKQKVAEYKKRNIYYRFLFLAVHDTLKNRGHFLSDAIIENIDDFSNLESIIQGINNLSDYKNFCDNFSVDFTQIGEQIKNYILNVDSEVKLNNSNNEIYKLLLGKKTNFQQFLELDNKFEICYETNELEELINKQELFSYIDFIEKTYLLYQKIFLYKILKENNSISEYRVNLYNTFKKQLNDFRNDLKLLDSKYNTNYYNDFFVNKIMTNNYTNKSNGYFNLFIGNKIYKISDEKVHDAKKVRNHAISKLNNIIKIHKEFIVEKNLFEYIPFNKNGNDKDYSNFLITQKGPQNRNFPNQIYLNEINNILQLSDLSDEKKDHIKKLITFKVDYYVGKIKGTFSWAKLNDTSQKLTPYNYDQLIDKAETNKVFIKRMLRKCTYFQNENCMQQETILYQLYIFYNTINKLKINSIPISTEQKNSVFDCLVEGGELTERKLRNILKISNDDIISGVNLDNNLNHLSLSAIKKFKSVFDENTSACDSKYSLFFDDFVNACALIDKKNKALKRKVIEKLCSSESYKHLNILEGKDILNKLEKMSFNGKWGNLSALFLQTNMFYFNNETFSIINILKTSNLNLQEILYLQNENSKTNVDLIDEYNQNHNNNFDISNITFQNHYNTSALNKYLETKLIPNVARRTIIQTVLIINEIIHKIMKGEQPTNITIEFTRENKLGKNNKTENSRVKKLSSLYNKIKTYQNEFLTTTDKKALVDLLNNKEKNLKSKKLLLYFLQLGKDIYTGKPIDINDLSKNTGNKYDIDHIHPRSLGGEDSIYDNLVLTENTINNIKGNGLVHQEWINKQKNFWLYLHKNKLLSSKKLERLLRTKEYSPYEIEAFVNSQKNVLDWINIRTAELLKLLFGENQTNDFITYSKSGIVSKFRNNYGLVKYRELNNFHHAHDAYLNYYVSSIVKNNLKAPNTESENSKYKYTYYSPKIVEYYTNTKAINFINDFKKYLTRPDIVVTFKQEFSPNGALWDQNILSKNNNSKTFLPIKKALNDKKYGHFASAKTIFLSVVEKKGKKELLGIKAHEFKNFKVNSKFSLEKLGL